MRAQVSLEYIAMLGLMFIVVLVVLAVAFDIPQSVFSQDRLVQVAAQEHRGVSVVGAYYNDSHSMLMLQNNLPFDVWVNRIYIDDVENATDSILIAPGNISHYVHDRVTSKYDIVLGVNSSTFDGNISSGDITYSSSDIVSADDELFDGLKAHWTMDASNSTHFYDVVNGYDLAIQGGGGQIHGLHGSAFGMDGLDDYGIVQGTLMASEDIDAQITVATWVNITDTGTNMAWWASESQMQISSTLPRFRIRNSTNGYVFNDHNVDPVIDQWNFFVGTYNGSHIQYYINGLASNEQTTGGNIFTTSLMYIGIDEGVATYLNGSVDEFMIWNRSLSQSEIQRLYNSMR